MRNAEFDDPFRVSLVRAAGFEPANSCSQGKPIYPSVERPDVKNWLRGEDSNLCFLVQSQASCQLDDPEKLAPPARFDGGS